MVPDAQQTDTSALLSVQPPAQTAPSGETQAHQSHHRLIPGSTLDSDCLLYTSDAADE